MDVAMRLTSHWSAEEMTAEEPSPIAEVTCVSAG
jgi:hypothetical protein